MNDESLGGFGGQPSTPPVAPNPTPVVPTPAPVAPVSPVPPMSTPVQPSADFSGGMPAPIAPPPMVQNSDPSMPGYQPTPENINRATNGQLSSDMATIKPKKGKKVLRALGIIGIFVLASLAWNFIKVTIPEMNIKKDLQGRWSCLAVKSLVVGYSMNEVAYDFSDAKFTEKNDEKTIAASEREKSGAFKVQLGEIKDGHESDVKRLNEAVASRFGDLKQVFFLNLNYDGGGTRQNSVIMYEGGLLLADKSNPTTVVFCYSGDTAPSMDDFSGGSQGVQAASGDIKSI